MKYFWRFFSSWMAWAKLTLNFRGPNKTFSCSLFSFFFFSFSLWEIKYKKSLLKISKIPPWQPQCSNSHLIHFFSSTFSWTFHSTAFTHVSAISDGKCLACTYRSKFVEVSVGINHNVDELLAGTLTQIRLKKEHCELQVFIEFSFVRCVWVSFKGKLIGLSVLGVNRSGVFIGQRFYDVL